MKPKPQPQRDVAVESANPSIRRIAFYASADAVADFKEFGRLTNCFEEKEKYELWVSARFDFQQVIDYIEHYSDPEDGDGLDLE